jgi:hypothetical protein
MLTMTRSPSAERGTMIDSSGTIVTTTATMKTKERSPISRRAMAMILFMIRLPLR